MHDMHTASGKKSRKIKLGFVIVLKSKCHVGNYLVEFEHFPLLYCFRINRENLNLLDFWWQDDTYMGLNRMLLFIFIFGSLKKTLLFRSTSTWYGIFSFLRLVPSQFWSWTGLFFFCHIVGFEDFLHGHLVISWGFNAIMSFQICQASQFCCLHVVQNYSVDFTTIKSVAWY